MGNIYIGDTSSKAKELKSIYVGDTNNKARKVNKIYIGDTNNKARLAWSSGIPYDIILANGSSTLTISTNGGTSFSTLTTSIPISIISYDFLKEIYVAINTDNTPYYSKDLKTWTVCNRPWGNASSGITINQLICSDGVYIVSAMRGSTYISTDLMNWKVLHTRSYPTFVTHDKNSRNTAIFYELSNGTGNVGYDIVSMDGTSLYMRIDNNIAYVEPIVANNYFVTSYSTYLSMRSTTSPTSNEIFNTTPFRSYGTSYNTPKFAYINNKLIAFANGTIYSTSDSGATWSTIGTYPNNNSTIGLGYINGIYILYSYKYNNGYNHYIYKSTDLSNWTQVYHSTSVNLKMFIARENFGLY